MSKLPMEQDAHPDELLPWFVNNTLAGEELRTVKDHLETCNRCQQEVQLLESMRAQAKSISIRSPGDIGLNRLLHEIKQENVSTPRTKLSQPGWWRSGFAIAASLIIMIQAGLLIDAWFLSTPIVPLSGPQQLQGTILQIAFTPSATAEQIAESLHAIHGTIIDGPSRLGIYRVRLHDNVLDQKSINHAIALLRKDSTIVSHVAQE